MTSWKAGRKKQPTVEPSNPPPASGSTDPGDPPVPPKSGGGQPLRWTPPGYPDYTGYTVLYPTDAAHVFQNLPSTTNYLIILPGAIPPGGRAANSQTTPLHGSGEQDPNRAKPTALVVQGGNNIVMIGGWIYVPDQNIPRWGLPSSSTGHSSFPGTQNSSENLIGISMRRAMAIGGHAGTWHIEGVLINGSDLSEGIQASGSTTGNIIQIQNTRIEAMHARDEGTSTLNNFTDNHPDHIAADGVGWKHIRVDYFTGETDYQSLKFEYGLNMLTTDVSHYNCRPYNNWSRYYCYCTSDVSPYTPSCTQAYQTNTVWLQPATNRVFNQCIYHPNGWTFSSDATSEYAVPTSSSSSLITGRIRKGIPSTGDYVPINTVGVDYESPGYL